jgi:hypothetical protein
MAISTALKPPAELGKPGRALWAKATEAFTFQDPRELLALAHSCQLEDDLARLRRELVDSPLVVKGSTGQPVENPLLGSIRNGLALQAKLLGSIAVPEAEQARAHAGRALVAQRWGN